MEGTPDVLHIPHRQARLPRRRPLAAAGTDRLERRDDPGSAGHVVCTVGERELADDHTVHATSSMSAQPFGAACAAVPKSGKGSFDGMSQDPVATAASNNPLLSTLVRAVTKAGLVDTLNNAKGITVFAPTNDAFAKIDKATLDKVLADKATLTAILTEHVVGQTLTPDKLAGTFATLNPKQGVMVTGSGEDFMVNKTAKVLCGNVQSANATVYIIDTVLLPAS